MADVMRVEVLGRWTVVWRCALAILIGVAAAAAGGMLGSLLWHTAEAVQLCVAPPALVAGAAGCAALRGRPPQMAVSILGLYALGWAVAFLGHAGPPYQRSFWPAFHLGLAAAGTLAALVGFVLAAHVGRRPAPAGEPADPPGAGTDR
ncbi:hypothetical protein Athai_43690 [Actinocatenispora thailandica]|uniref:Uncharacterized protein n=1 Tax=Actinocatenispora thailandica TaxID=227318 RepID=A0A7R7DSE1_9ACTN|nr:hypothetical protein [Actinocatenispora thailandica]BCJ36866.1 hypothetical protein Athai_43690 [Actinocatenispora thailandica]